MKRARTVQEPFAPSPRPEQHPPASLERRDGWVMVPERLLRDCRNLLMNKQNKIKSPGDDHSSPMVINEIDRRLAPAPASPDQRESAAAPCIGDAAAHTGDAKVDGRDQPEIVIGLRGDTAEGRDAAENRRSAMSDEVTSRAAVGNCVHLVRQGDPVRQSDSHQSEQQVEPLDAVADSSAASGRSGPTTPAGSDQNAAPQAKGHSTAKHVDRFAQGCKSTELCLTDVPAVAAPRRPT